MHPPHYRVATETYPTDKSCRTCLSEVAYERRLTCIKYLAYVRINTVCDTWKDGKTNLVKDNEADVLFGYKQDVATAEERIYLSSQKLSDEDAPA